MPVPTPASTPASWPRPTAPRVGTGIVYRLGRVLAPNIAYRRLAAWLEAHPVLRRWFTCAERVSKQELFGCRMCGQCALPVTGYACPMTCPKQLRNGPCGGVGADGSCEVFPEERCVWVIAVERAEQSGHAEDLMRMQRPLDHRLWGTSSWLNYWQGRDEDLWTDPIDAGGRPSLLVGAFGP